MKIATTTGDFARYYSADIDRLRALHAAGFRYVDLNMYSFKTRSVYMGTEWREAALALKNEAEKLGMTFVQAHSQGGNPLSEDENAADFIVAATLRSLEICEILGIPHTVSHPGILGTPDKEAWFEKNRAYYQKLFPMMEKTGVNVLTENSCAANMGISYFANTGKDMVEFLSFVGHPQLHACWDTGHANCEGAQYDEILALGGELRAIHYHDNRGEKDEHLLPFFGTLNHDEIINALIDVGFQGYFTLEADSPVKPRRHWIGDRRSFRGEGRLSDPPLFMQERLEALSYETAKYMLSSYGLFEE